MKTTSKGVIEMDSKTTLTTNEQNHNPKDSASSIPNFGESDHNPNQNSQNSSDNGSSGEVDLESAVAEKATSNVTRPRGIKPQHWEEWVGESCVSPGIVKENVESIDASKSGTIASLLNRPWDHDFGGWWVSGVNPQDNEYVDFGQFKPDKTRTKNGKELYKYITPKGSGSEAIFLCNPDQPDFWQQEISEVIITEGAKKAGAAITQGFHAICLTGVWNGQVRKERLVASLRDYIRSQPQGLKVNLCFDADLWSNRQVGRALLNLGELLEWSECEVEVTDLSVFGNKKGIDDVIATRGVEAFREALENAYPFNTYWELVENLPLSAVQEGFQHLYERDKWIKYDDQLHWWNGSYFEPQSESAEMSRITKWCNSFRDSIYQDHFQDKEGLYDTPHSKPSMPRHIYNTALHELYVDPERVNPPNVLNLKNGVLELEWGKYDFTEKFYEHSPTNHYKFTYVTDVAYDEAADPTYCDQLLEAIPEQYRDIMLKNMAASLDLGEVRKRVGSHVRSIILWGHGSNGKDALRAAISNIFSERYLTSLTLSHFQAADKSGRGFTIYPLLNSKLNWSSENKGKLNIDEIDSLKNTLTGDPVVVERKNVDQVDLRAKCVCVFNTNHEPNIKGYNEAIRRRLTVVKMDRTFTTNPKKPGELQANPNFINSEWLAEHVSPSLLNVMLFKLHDLLRNGCDYEPAAQLMGEVAETSDHFLQFANEVGLKEDPDGMVTAPDLWFKLREWYFQEGYVQNATGAITTENEEQDHFINYSKFDQLVTQKPALTNRVKQSFNVEVKKPRIDGKPTRCYYGISLPDES
jgi:phage/plasmid-associated DNA primase